ncbi:alanine aminotransferase 2-like protein [Dinothrombium tinctorium]|uniref:alanine transaminase n=1 Tax=Dinothrombium tinctorium TaxID=1965070 RepID=A0A443R2R2_9ACAR|nr:alanine aminotransferase 2-like protein [Dinothrombium tinctorium]
MRPILRHLIAACEWQTLRMSLVSNAILSSHVLDRSVHTTRTMGAEEQPLVTLSNINPNVKRMEYAVRGPLVIRAGQLEKELQAGKKLPFDEVIRANIGDCHAMNQKPLTFMRQVISACANPDLLETDLFPSDVKERVKLLLSFCGGRSVGAYSDSAGVEIIRRHCAEYIEKRDGIPTDYLNIVLTTGASEAVRAVLALINSSTADGIPTGVMIPIPQYPLYTATLAEYGMTSINYYLDESNNWQLQIEELQRALDEARGKCNPKALVVINPGNPTGSVLTHDNIKNIINFARKEKLMILADEVYQHNIYAENARFYSFKKVMHEMQVKLELASLMSASKGYMGECGLRGGYCELLNFDPDVKAMFFKMLSARLCSSVLGQIAMDCVVKPPEPGDPSYDLHEKEKSEVLESLKHRAQLAADTFNSIPGMKCNIVAGAMYAFPQIILPEKAIKAAQSLNQAPDFFYAMNLLESTGVCIIPGSGFGQIPGTYHFRTTILPQPDHLRRMMEKVKKFHVQFLEKYT